jgi:hypothetical protein
MTDYAGLIERLESGSGPDEDLAFDICLACGYSSPPLPIRGYKGDVLGSLDAALAFAEAVGAPIEQLQWVPDAVIANSRDASGIAPSAPRACLITTLRALQEQHND